MNTIKRYQQKKAIFDLYYMILKIKMHFLLTQLFSRFNSISPKPAIYKEAALKKLLSEYSLMLFLSNLHCVLHVYLLPAFTCAFTRSKF